MNPWPILFGEVKPPRWSGAVRVHRLETPEDAAPVPARACRQRGRPRKWRAWTLLTAAVQLPTRKQVAALWAPLEVRP